jgi:hypothetical protein
MYFIHSPCIVTYKYYEIVTTIFVIHITRDSPQVEIRENEKGNDKKVRYSQSNQVFKSVHSNSSVINFAFLVTCIVKNPYNKTN